MAADEIGWQLLDDAPHGRIHLEDTTICVDEHLTLHALDIADVVDGYDVYLPVEFDNQLRGCRSPIGVSLVLFALRGVCFECARLPQPCRFVANCF